MNNRFFAFIALLFAVGIFFVYINPMWTGQIADTKASIADIDKALAAAKEYAARQQQLATERDAIDPAGLTRLNTFLPDSVDNVRIILDLNALASRTGFALSSIDVTGNAKGTSGNSSESLSSTDVSPVGSIDLSLSAVGTYTAFQNFMQGIERSQRLLDVRDLSVSGSNTGLYTYAMTVRLYWLR